LTTGSQRLQGSTCCCKLETESWSRVGVEKRMSLHAHCCTVQASLSFYPLDFTKPPCMISYPWSPCFLSCKHEVYLTKATYDNKFTQALQCVIDLL
jgi:hypothetical protein